MTRELQTKLTSPHEEAAPTGRRFLRRLIVAIMAGYCLAMLLFVAVSFAAERRMYYLETFLHLDETLGVLASVPGTGAIAMGSALQKAEAALEQQTKVAHRVMVVDGDGAILAAGSPDLDGKLLAKVFNLEPYGTAGEPWRQGKKEGTRWLGSSIMLPAGGAGVHLVLLRSGRNIDQFVRMFVSFHGVHLVVTVLVFLLLLQVIGRRLVQQPLRSLISLIRDVESGKLTAEPSQDLEDELVWLARRFSHMGQTLQETIEQLVRAEKYAAVSMVAFRAAREMQSPLDALKRHILYLESLAENDANIRVIGTSLREDRQKLVEVLARLEAIEPPDFDNTDSVSQTAI